MTKILEQILDGKSIRDVCTEPIYIESDDFVELKRIFGDDEFKYEFTDGKENFETEDQKDRYNVFINFLKKMNIKKAKLIHAPEGGLYNTEAEEILKSSKTGTKLHYPEDTGLIETDTSVNSKNRLLGFYVQGYGRFNAVWRY